jgi:hypothetical protein
VKRSLLIFGFPANVCLMTNPAGSAIVNATGAIRQVVHGEDKIQRRYLVIAAGHPDKPGRIVQVPLK